MKICATLLAASAFLIQSGSEPFPGREWRVAAPAVSGWSEARLSEARELSSKLGSSAVFVVHSGLVVAQWGDVTKPINVRSVRKSLLNALIGISVERQQLLLDRTLADLRIDDADPALDPSEKRATVADLLTSRSGVYHPAAYEVPGTARPVRHSHKPGEFFFYNNWDFNVLGSIYERVAGRTVFQAFDAEIARPLRMQDFDASQHTQSLKEPVSIHAAYIFRMSARDLARFGWLYANAGNWAGAQIVSESWVSQSTQPHVPNARAQNAYGYLWWVNINPKTREHMFWAAGAGGQFVLVVPARRVVIVHLVDIPVLAEAIADNRTVSWGDFFRLARMIAAAGP